MVASSHPEGMKRTEEGSARSLPVRSCDVDLETGVRASSFGICGWIRAIILRILAAHCGWWHRDSCTRRLGLFHSNG